MPARPTWKGHLKLSLVTCPVSLYPATKVERVSFRHTNRATGNRLRQQLVDEVTGEVIDRGRALRGFEASKLSSLPAEDERPKRPPVEVAVSSAKSSRRPLEAEPLPEAEAPSLLPELPRGYEIPSTRFIPVEDEELAALRAERSRIIEIERFVPRDQIDLRYLDSHYYVVPNEPVGQEAFAVIREAMGDSELVAMGRVVLSRRERPIILDPSGKGLRGVTLRSANEVRDEADYFAEIPNIDVPKDMLDVACHLVRSKRADFDPAQLEDRFEASLLELLRRKQGDVPTGRDRQKPMQSGTVVNLMDVLRQSLAASKPSAGTAPRQKAVPAKKPRLKKPAPRKVG